jgi:hypothetical protein
MAVELRPDGNGRTAPLSPPTHLAANECYGRKESRVSLPLHPPCDLLRSSRGTVQIKKLVEEGMGRIREFARANEVIG